MRVVALHLHKLRHNLINFKMEHYLLRIELSLTGYPSRIPRINDKLARLQIYQERLLLKLLLVCQHLGN